MGDIYEAKREPLGEILYKLRKENKYVQQEIADYLGIDRSTYAKYETSRKAELDVIIRLAALYGISVDELLGDYRGNVIDKKNLDMFTKAAAPETDEGIRELTLEELRLLNLFRKSIRKNDIIGYARKIAAEDCGSSENQK